MWDVREGQLLYTITGHYSPVNSIAFSNDGKYFASASSASEVVMVWESNFDNTTTKNDIDVIVQDENENQIAEEEEIIKEEEVEVKVPSTKRLPMKPKYYNNVKTENIMNKQEYALTAKGQEKLQKDLTNENQNKKEEEEKKFKIQMENTLGFIVQQLGTMTEALKSLDRRITSVNERVQNLEANQS